MPSLRLPGLTAAVLMAASLLLQAAPASARDFLSRAVTPSSPPSPLASRLIRLAPRADPQVLRLAARALSCADPGAERLAVIDFSLPSTEQRLWVFDLARDRLLFRELVSHGQGSGDAMASEFSNIPDSHQSSIGLFRTLNSYEGSNGYSLRLEGLEPGVNDLAFQRAIVIHGADYVSKSFIERTGRLGRSYGCPAVRDEIAVPLIDSLKDSQYLFTYYPDPEWLAESAFLRCPRDGQHLAMQR